MILWMKIQTISGYPTFYPINHVETCCIMFKTDDFIFKTFREVFHNLKIHGLKRDQNYVI